LCPHFADLRVKLSNVYRHMNDLPAARYELEEAIRVRPRFNPARVAMGVLLLVSGQRQKALEQWEEALRVEPDNKAAQMYLRMARHPSPHSDPPR
jgi:tetratricopeptide (TPR) repeat protein